MKSRQELEEQLIENRLMQNYEETELFEEAMNALFSDDNIENISTSCKAFDDSTNDHEVMFGLVHGIENYDIIFTPMRSTQKLIESITLFNSNSKDWQEIIFLRILNNNESIKLFSKVLNEASDENKNQIIPILKRIIERDKNKFERIVNEVLKKIV